MCLRGLFSLWHDPHNLRVFFKTFHVLHFSEGTETYIYILCNYSTLIWHGYLKSFPMQDQDLHILHRQYHGCWYPGDVRSQGISSHGIDPSLTKITRSPHVKVYQDYYLSLYIRIENGTHHHTRVRQPLIRIDIKNLGYIIFFRLSRTYLNIKPDWNYC